MIKPEDLQLYDYVSVNDNIEKVLSISEDFIDTEIYLELIPEEVNPIYLTDEFLQKNGFERYFTYKISWFDEESTRDINKIPINAECVKVHWRKLAAELWKYAKNEANRLRFMWNEDNTPHTVQYVHELQHLMRLYNNSTLII